MNNKGLKEIPLREREKEKGIIVPHGKSEPAHASKHMAYHNTPPQRGGKRNKKNKRRQKKGIKGKEWLNSK